MERFVLATLLVLLWGCESEEDKMWAAIDAARPQLEERVDALFDEVRQHDDRLAEQIEEKLKAASLPPQDAPRCPPERLKSFSVEQRVGYAHDNPTKRGYSQVYASALRKQDFVTRIREIDSLQTLAQMRTALEEYDHNAASPSYILVRNVDKIVRPRTLGDGTFEPGAVHGTVYLWDTKNERFACGAPLSAESAAKETVRTYEYTKRGEANPVPPTGEVANDVKRLQDQWTNVQLESSIIDRAVDDALANLRAM